MQNYWPSLSEGAHIRIISSARKITQQEVDPAKDLLEENGFQVSYGKSLFKSDDQFAGRDEDRASDLQEAINDHELDAIWFARGGYGSHRILEQIDWFPLREKHKIFMGYSDITVFHLMLSAMHIPSIHSTMPVNVHSQSERSFTELFELLKGKKISYEIPHHKKNVLGEAEGILIGGNLSIIYSMTGTPYLPKFEGCILFFEDLDEYLYHIDRMMMNLKLGKYLSKLSGIIVGGMSDMNDNTIPFGKNALEIVHEHVSTLNIPVCFGFPAGHQEVNLPLMMGTKLRLSVKENGSRISY